MSQIPLKAQSVTQAPHHIARPFGIRDKLGYLFGDFGNDFFFILVNAFLMVYYTDIFHIHAAAVGLLFLIARLWDAVADITWGRFIDTRKPSKHGKFKPWIFRMSFPLVLSGVLMFVKIPGMSDGFYLAYAFVTYIVWGTLYSTVNIPYGSMASVISSNPIDRTALSTYRTMGAMLAGLVINVVGPLLLFVNNKADADRFTMGAVLFGVLSISCYMACYKLSTERIVQTDNIKINFAKTLKGLIKNRPLLIILAASLLFMVCFMMIGTVNVYLFKDYFGSTKALSTVGLIQTAVAFMAIPAVKPLVSRFGKKTTISLGLLLSSAAYLILYLLPSIGIIPFIAILAVAMFGYAFFNLLIWAFVTDVIDYHEYVTGLREDGTVYSIYSFARKVGQAVAGGVGGFAIAAIGYNATGKVQTQNALEGIHFLGTLVPSALMMVVLLIIVFFYPLNKQRTEQLADDLNSIRSSHR
jgi:GPH family glycoside/pentoside/hexuronide:cation symporter